MRGTRLSRSAIGLSATLLLLATACGGGEGEPETQEQRTGGSFIMAISEPQYLTTTNSNETGGSQVLQALFSGLVEYDAETSEPVNVMAESVTSDDLINWTITIKDGWTFHDGTPVTAQSFVDAWNYGANAENAQNNSYFYARIEGYEDLCPKVDPETGVCAGKVTTDAMSGLQVVDDTTFTVTLSDPFALFPTTLGYGAFYPLPDVFFDDPEAFQEAPIGNGPYQMDGVWEHDKFIKVKRYADYAGTPGNAEAVEFRLYGNLTAPYRDLQAGVIDIVDLIPPEEIANAQAEFGDRYLEDPSSSYAFLAFPFNEPAFGEIEDPQAKADLRVAFSLAIDREAIMEALFLGTRVAAHEFVSPVVQGFREGSCAENTEYDPERAKELFDSAGGYDGTLTIWFNNDGGHEGWIEAVANNWRQNLGIEDIEFESYGFDDYLTKLDNREVTGPFRLGWVMDYPSIQNYLGPIHSTGGSSNNSLYSNPEFDALLEQGDAVSIEEGVPIYQQAEDILCEDMPHIPVYHSVNQTAWTDRIDNVQVDALSFLRVDEVEVVGKERT